VAWILRLVKIGAEGEGRSVDVMEGKSPREVMTGQAHPHWLTLLGLGLPQPLRD